MDMTKQEAEDLGAELIRECEQLTPLRATLETQYQEVATYVSPQDRDTFQGQYTTPGQKKNLDIFDSTALIALDRFVSIMDSLVTPHDDTWHGLETLDPMLNRRDDVKRYFEDVTRRIFQNRYSAGANFMMQNQLVWHTTGAYGYGSLFVDGNKRGDGLRYRNIPVREAFLVEDHNRNVVGMYRRYRMNAYQAYGEFGDALPEEIREQYKKAPNTFCNFWHIVKLNDKMDPERADYRGMKYSAYDVSVTGKLVIRKSGFRSFPYPTMRYKPLQDSAYSDSIAMMVLPTIKTLNKEKKDLLTQGDRALNPIFLVHDDGVMSMESARPGSEVVGGVNADGRPLVHTLQAGNVQIGQEIMQDDRNTVNDVFLVNLFQVLLQTKKEMTAAEVYEWAKEKGVLVTPTLARTEAYTNQLIERELDILNFQGQLPPPPPILRGASGLKYKVKYQSPLSKLRQAGEVAGFNRLLQQAIQIATATRDPTALMYFDMDTYMPEAAYIEGVPSRWIKSKEAVAVIKQQQQQAQQAQQISEAAPGIAQVLKATQGQ